MSDNLSKDEDNLLTETKVSDELSVFKSSLDFAFDKSIDTWVSLVNEANIKIENTKFSVSNISDIAFSESDLHAKLRITEGMNAAALIAVSPSDIKKLANYMMGMMLDEESLEDIEMQQGALTECTNQFFGSLCTKLTRSIDDVLQIDAPEFFNVGTISSEEILHDISKREKNFLITEHEVNVADEFKVKIILAMTEATANSLVFRIKNTESKNLLKQNPELSRSIAEYFTLLASKYKVIFSMVGVNGNVSVSEINSIHSLQCLDSSVINNYSVSNKVSGNDILNAYVFEKSFVDDMKALSYDADMGEDMSWDILKELNRQFSQIFTEYCSDNKLVFDNIDCESYLSLPDHQYLLISFKVGTYSFYQMITFNLVDKLTFKLSREEKATVDYSMMTNAYLQQQNEDNSESSSNTVSIVDEILATYKNVPMEVSAVLGEREYLLRDLLRFSPGYVIHFNRKVSEDIDICINNVYKAKGEVGERRINKSNNYAIKLKKIKKEKC